MKMSKLLAAVSMLTLLVAAVPAQAQDTAFYFGAKGGLTLQHLGSMRVDPPTGLNPPLASTDLNTTMKLGAGVSAAFGYDLYPYYFMPLRVEAEVSYLFKSTNEGSNVVPVAAHLGVSSFIAQANFYFDMHNTSRFTPYIGGGLGFARNWVDGDLSIRGGVASATPRRNVNTLAWNASAGVRVDLSNNMGVELAYRYQGLGKVRTNIGTNGAVEANLARHDIFLGLYVKI